MTDTVVTYTCPQCGRTQLGPIAPGYAPVCPLDGTPMAPSPAQTFDVVDAGGEAPPILASQK